MDGLNNPAAATQRLALPSELATRRLAMDVAAMLQAGDLVTLSGELGAGKTTFARTVIRLLAEDPGLEVPSPSFTLLQHYALPRFPVVHVDLYRVSDPSELGELGLEEASAGAAVLLEWPDRAPNAWAADRLDIAFMLAPAEGLGYRHAELTGYGAFAPRLERLLAIRRFLDQSGFSEAERRYLQGDASTRAYEYLQRGTNRFVLMNSPRRSDGPPVRNGRPYSAIAHLAEDVIPFVAVARGLAARGFSAPEIYAGDLAQGLLILEDLGRDGIVEASQTPIKERYALAVDVLSALHQQDLPTVLPVAPGIAYELPPYDLPALLIEIELMLDWYLPACGVKLKAPARAELLAAWRNLLGKAVSAPPTWVLRDYHSPNLLWLAERHGLARLGLLDFQDAVLGPAAYDLVSLLQDARIDIPENLEMALLGRYVRSRKARERDFDAAAFLELYAVLGAQRATKLLGIFVRLNRRDGKPQYLRHLPRIWGYLKRSLAHPTLAPIRRWYDTHVPVPGEAQDSASPAAAAIC